MDGVFEEVKNRLGFGCMRFPLTDNKDIDMEQVKRMVDLFIERGFNYFDTAHGYLDQRSEGTLKTCLVSRHPRESYLLADKLSNMRDIDRDYPVAGDDLWKRFRMQSKSALAWYYKGIRDVLKENFSGVAAYEEYCRLIDKNFGPEPAHTDWKKGDR